MPGRHGADTGRHLLPPARAAAALGRARSNRIVGMDIVEIAPSFDFANGLTCITAGRLILNVLSASWSEGGGCR